MKPAPAIAAVLLLACTVAADRPPAPRAPSPDVKHLLTMPLADDFTAGREVLVDVVTLPPNTSLERHWHPGEEFHYYLEGGCEIRVEGQPPIEGKPGTVGHVPFKVRHQAVAGPEGAKIVVFRVHTTGQPWRYTD